MRQEEAYESAADLWDQSTELYRDAADELLKVEEVSSKKSRPELSVDDLNVIESLRWAEARAMVRAGEVFNGVNQLEALMTYRLAQQSNPEYTKRTERPSSLPMDAIREELAAAQYVGARLLREEGRPPEIWRPVANSARQHYQIPRVGDTAKNPRLKQRPKRELARKQRMVRPNSIGTTASNATWNRS